ncbi:MAG: sugar ABC transporter ATP-binding protein [Planctomycetota bacterium]
MVARGLSKRFGAVAALEGVDLDVRAGEVLAVVGENGAGKSTLMHCLAGGLRPDSGQLEIDGSAVHLDSPRAAQRAGIALIHQELELCEGLDAAANVALGRESSGLWLKRGGEREEADRWLAELGADFPSAAPVAELSLGRRQLVEIARALAARARVVIFDEPTSSLTERETRALLKTIGDLRARGTAVIYISHRLGEVLDLADRAVVLRDGRRVAELQGATLTREGLVEAMVGRVGTLAAPTPFESSGGPALLDVRAAVLPQFTDGSISLAVHPGEIVALAGLVGAGRSELLESLAGLQPLAAGDLRLGGESFAPRSPADARRAGIALAPEDRKGCGLFLELTCTDNVGLGGLEVHHARGLFRPERALELFDRWRERLSIAAGAPHLPARSLSGGNQQKLVLGRWLALEPRLLLLDEPSRGVDVGARAEIHAQVRELAARGIAVLFASSDPEELLGLAQRIVVLRDGSSVAELAGDDLNEQTLLERMLGAHAEVASR